MNNQATLDKMKELRLNGMHRTFQNLREGTGVPELTADELVGHLIDSEWEERHNRKLSRLVKDSNLKHNSRIQEVDFNASRNLDKNQVLRFNECGWITKHENMIITGATGTGKSFLASALGFSGCTRGFKVKYVNAMKFFGEMKFAQTAGTYSKIMAKLKKYDLLILDDFGLNTFDRGSRLTLLEILEDRSARSSTMILTQLPIESWHEVIGDNTIADAVCDRIIHSSHKIYLKGESMRKKYSPILETSYR